MKILFVCKYNRFRSKVAEAFFKKMNKDKRITARSAGIIEVDKPLLPSEIERNKYLKEKYGLTFDNKSRGIKVSYLMEADKIIIVADDVSKDIFCNRQWRDKVTVWQIPDEPAADRRNIDKSVGLILDKIKQLVNKK